MLINRRKGKDNFLIGQFVTGTNFGIILSQAGIASIA